MRSPLNTKTGKQRCKYTFSAYRFTTFLPHPVRHTQEIHAGGDATQVHRRGLAVRGRDESCGGRDESCGGRDSSRPYKPPLQIVQGRAGDARAAGQLDVQEVAGGVGESLECCVIGERDGLQ